MENQLAGNFARKSSNRSVSRSIAAAQLCDTGAVFAIRHDELSDTGKLLLQRATVHVEAVFVNLIQDNDHRRVAAEAFDQPHPVVRVHVFRAFAPVKDEKVKTPLGQEKLVRRVHDFLTAEVPNIETHIFLIEQLHRPLE